MVQMPQQQPQQEMKRLDLIPNSKVSSQTPKEQQFQKQSSEQMSLQQRNSQPGQQQQQRMMPIQMDPSLY